MTPTGSGEEHNKGVTNEGAEQTVKDQRKEGANEWLSTPTTDSRPPEGEVDKVEESNAYRS